MHSSWTGFGACAWSYLRYSAVACFACTTTETVRIPDIIAEVKLIKMFHSSSLLTVCESAPVPRISKSEGIKWATHCHSSCVRALPEACKSMTTPFIISGFMVHMANSTDVRYGMAGNLWWLLRLVPRTKSKHCQKLCHLTNVSALYHCDIFIVHPLQHQYTILET